MYQGKKSAQHNLYHYLFVAGVGLVQDASAASIGVLLVLAAILLFQTSSSDIAKTALAFPLLLVGFGVFLLNIIGIFFYLFDKGFSFNHCPFCNKTPS